jgi:transcriptional regulator NrdR family protein
MNCPRCGSSNTKVIGKKEPCYDITNRKIQLRKRKCNNSDCGYTWDSMK